VKRSYFALAKVGTHIQPITNHMHNQEAITCFMTFHAHIYL